MEMKQEVHLNNGNFEKLIRTYIFIIISFFLIIIPVFLPLGFTPDNLNYYSTLNLPISQFDFLEFEPFYWLVVYINQILFNGSWTTFLLFFSTIYVILSIYLITRYSISPVMSFIIFVLLFYPNFGLIQIRNGVALAFCWWAIFDLMKEKKIIFIVKIFIATLFHYSSIFYFFILFFNRNRINKYVYLLLPIVGLILPHYIFKDEFFQLVISYLPTFLKFKAESYIYIKLYDPEHKLMQINIFLFFIYSRILFS